MCDTLTRALVLNQNFKKYDREQFPKINNTQSNFITKHLSQLLNAPPQTISLTSTFDVEPKSLVCFQLKKLLKLLALGLLHTITELWPCHYLAHKQFIVIHQFILIRCSCPPWLNLHQFKFHMSNFVELLCPNCNRSGEGVWHPPCSSMPKLRWLATTNDDAYYFLSLFFPSEI